MKSIHSRAACRPPKRHLRWTDFRMHTNRRGGGDQDEQKEGGVAAAGRARTSDNSATKDVEYEIPGFVLQRRKGPKVEGVMLGVYCS